MHFIHFTRLSAMFALLAMWPAVAAGQFADTPSDASKLVSVAALTDRETVGPGETFHVAVHFTIKPEWHIYWANPGEVGTPTRIDLDLPGGFEAGEILWPRPIAFDASGILSYGYADEVVLFVPVTAPDDVRDGRVEFPIRVDYLVCREQCLIGSATRRTTIDTSTAATADANATPLLQKFGERIPTNVVDVDEASLMMQGDELVVRIPRKKFDKAEFFPLPVPGISYGDPKTEIDGHDLVMRVAVAENPNNAQPGRPMVIAGVIGLGDKPSDPGYRFEVELEALRRSNTTSASGKRTKH